MSARNTTADTTVNKPNGGRKRKYKTEEESKLARKARDALRRACQVLIGEEIVRWQQLCAQLGMNHQQLAKFLLDRLVIII